MRFVRLILGVVDKAYVLTDSLLDGDANRMMYKDRLDLDVDQLYCQVCPKSQGCVINDQTISSTRSTGPVLPGDMAPATPARVDGHRPVRATIIYASPCVTGNVTFAEETIEVKGECD